MRVFSGSKARRTAAAPRADLKLGVGLLVALVLLHPISFVPMALFVGAPPIMSDSIRLDLMERYFFFPKLAVLVVFGVMALLEARKHSWRNAWTGLLCLHGLSVCASAVFANDELTFTLLGGSQRFDGVIYQLVLVVIGVFAYQTFRREPEGMRPVLWALLVAGMVQSVLVIAQRAGFDPIATSVRWKAFIAPAGSIGHPGMVAGMLLPMAVVGVWMVLNLHGWRSRLVPSVGLGLIGLGLSVVSNRSALIGLILALLVLNLRRRNLETLAASALLVTVVLFGRGLVPAGNGIDVNLGSTNTLETRRMIWPLSWQAVTHTPGQPLIGGGPDAFRLWLLRDGPLDSIAALNTVELSWPKNTRISSLERVLMPGQPVRETGFRVRFAQFGDRQNLEETYTIDLDRAHNLVLDRLVAYGGVSAVAWLVLYLWPMVGWWRGLFGGSNAIRPSRARRADDLSSALVAALIGLSVYYLTWFPVMQVEPLHLILLAAAWVLTSNPKPSPASELA